MNIEYCGFSHSFKKNENEIESDIIFKERCWFIVTLYPKWESELEDYNDLIKISKLWSNIKYKNCRYSSSIMKKIRNLTKNTIYEI